MVAVVTGDMTVAVITAMKNEMGQVVRDENEILRDVREGWCLG